MKLGVGGWNIPPPPTWPPQGWRDAFYIYTYTFLPWVARVWLKTAGGEVVVFFSGGVVHGKVLKFQSNRCSNFEENGRSRAPIVHFLAPLLASRDPVGIQSGSSRDPVGHQCREAAKLIKNTSFLQGLGPNP